ncbi:YlcI/YnfO family protein [Chroococcidiopsis sp. CCMEE 29]|uniref:YlcI/YnfO family protein n=1 Tax=Chroococcidiopsis sp. CCMEE 29 TaxID=155894 RepID=UPI002020CCFE|nr:YlcI/YnfO family protein [Chroococcidiopsis sp. CCMEE 29]
MEEREALTVRFPAGLLAQMRKHKSQDESLNDLVINALEREVRYRQGLAAHHRIVARREKIRQKTGTQPNSVDLIHQLREGSARYDRK